MRNHGVRNNGHAFHYRTYRFPHRPGRLSRRWQAAGRIGGTALGLSGALLAFGVLAGTLGLSAAAYVAGDLPNVQNLRGAPLPLSTFIYDRSGTRLLYVLEEERRELATLDEVPPVLQNATIAIEDKTFWSNPGIDVGGIVRAALENFQRGQVTQGASTITQQLIKTRLLGDERTFERKMKEALLAIAATQTYSKRELLEMYFNQIYYGNQAYGAKAAAKTYFGLGDLSKMTLGQAALLAGLPQAPSRYDPVANPDAARARRAQVLENMLEAGFVTPEQAAAAKAEPFKVTPSRTPIVYPHFVFRVREQLAEVLGNDRAAYTGGYKVYTTIDPELQEIAERDVRERVRDLKGNNVNNAALIAMEPFNGHILAYVGSADYYDNSPRVRGDFDVAGLGERQMGSSFKIYTYLAAFQRGFTPSTVLWDVRTTFGKVYSGGPDYRPQNAPDFQGRTAENGPLTIRQALRESLNIPAVKVTSLIGVDAIIDMVHQLGVGRDWDRTRLGISFGIGAGELTLREHISAYQVLANMGARIEPTMILKIVDRNGKVLKDFTKPETRQVISPQLAWLFTDILKDNTDPNGSWIFGSWTNLGRPAALKTGTTDDIRDVVAIGWVPQLLTAVWMGNADNSEMFGISSAMGPGVLWRKFTLDAIEHNKIPVAWYPRPSGIVDRVVCVKPGLFGGLGSGLLPSGGCPSSWRVSEHFIEGTEPKTDDRAFWGGGCVIARAERSEWTPDVIRWAAAGKNARLGVPICGVSPSPSPSASPGSSPSPAPSPTPGANPSAPPPGPPAPPKPTRKP